MQLLVWSVTLAVACPRFQHLDPVDPAWRLRVSSVSGATYNGESTTVCIPKRPGYRAASA